MCVCVCVCVCVMCFFSVFNSVWVSLFLLPQRPLILPLLHPFPPHTIDWRLFSPCYMTTLPQWSRSSLSSSISCLPSRPPLPSPLSSGSLAYVGLSLAMAPAVPSLLHPPDSVSVRCTTPCTWCHRIEGCFISLFLVTSNPSRSHISPNISASAYY